MKIIMKIFNIIKRVKNINLLIEPNIRYFWVVLRALYYIKLRGRLVSLIGEHTVEANYKHNIKAIYGANNRMAMLLYPISVIETLSRESRILVIGPRNENDIFMLMGLGFNEKNIVGLDLISYTSRIRLGDMHKIPFNNNEFDAVVCGWTLSYSTDPQLACSEIGRVVKSGGVIAVAVEYSTLSSDEEEELIGYNLQDFGRLPIRVNSVKGILELFKGEVGNIYFSHDAPLKISHSASGLVPNVSSVAVIFEKVLPGNANQV